MPQVRVGLWTSPVIALMTVPAARGLAQMSARADLARELDRCQIPGVEETVFCGHFDVPEDRSIPRGRMISLNVVVLPATTDAVAPDPLLFLAGGGVVPATRYARFLGRAFPDLHRQRDIVLIDQRGTWGSNR